MSASDTPDPADTLARTIWGEARGEGAAGMAAVAAVVMNRVRIAAAHGGRYWWGKDAEGVCRAQAQFACWNPGDPNRAKLLAVDDGDAEFRVALGIAANALAGRLQDPTLGATSYKVASLPWPHDWGPPRQPLITIGKHAFYNLTED
jgi:spore germination cell wall hydrolase CwlJ-like protein